MSESKSEQGGREKERVRKNALLLFSKPPIPGLVKTRLTVLKDGVFQPEVASGLYHCMLFDVVEICCAAMADLERESAERAREALAAGEEVVRDEYEMIISTTPAKNVEVMRKLFSDAGEWPRELVFLCDEGASFDEHYNQAFEKTWARGADCILSMGADMPALGGVYKLSALYPAGGGEIPKIKLSDNTEKITNPGFKQVYRIYGADGKAEADLICLRDESIDVTRPLTIFHPVDTWKTTTFTDYTVRPLSVPVFLGGKQVYEFPPLSEVCSYAAREKESFWEEYKRLINPHVYKVDLSQKLYDVKKELIAEIREENG